MAPSVGRSASSPILVLVPVVCLSYITVCLISSTPINNNDNAGRHQYEWPMTNYMQQEHDGRRHVSDRLLSNGGGDGGGKRIVCYYHNVAARRPDKGQLLPNQIDPLLCTHLIYSHFILSEYGEVKSHDKELDLGESGGLKKFASLKRSNDRLKILISIDDSSTRFSKVSGSLESRARFIKSALSMVEEYQFDGIDLAWKYPADYLGRPSDKRNYILLLRELSLTLKPRGYLLTAPVSIDKDRIEEGYDVAQMSKYLDMIHLRAFDYFGGWDNFTGLHAPLYRSMRNDPRRLQVSMNESRPPSDDVDDITLNIDWSVNRWLKLGAPASKINLGIAAYGRSYKLSHENQFGLKAPTAGPASPGPYLNDNMLLAYNELCASFNERPSRWTVIRVPESEMPYAHRDLDWVSYEDRVSVAIKANYAATVKSLGGVAVFSIDMDDFRGSCHNRERFPLTKSIRKELGDASATTNGVSSTSSSISSITSTTTTAEPVTLVDVEVAISSSSTTKGDVPRNQPVTEASPTSSSTNVPPPPPPTSPQTPPPPASGEGAVSGKKAIVCYYNNEASRRSSRGRLNLNKVNASLCTHLIYAHLTFDEGDMKIKSLLENDDNEADSWTTQLSSLKEKDPSLMVMVALGGETDDGLKYSRMAAEPKSRTTFSRNLIEFMDKNKLDGLSLDWEWPEASDKANYISLLAGLRGALQAPRVLMVTAPTAKESLEAGYDVQEVAKRVDLINLKTHEFAMGKGSIRTRAHAPLYSSKYDETSKERQQNVNWTVNYFLNQGAPAHKLGLGLGLAGDSYTLTSSSENRLNRDATLGPAAPHTQSAGFWSYQEICKAFKEQKEAWTVVRDSDCQCTYAYNGIKWLAYDSLEDIQRKGQYANSKQLGGVALFTVDLDDFTGQCHQEKFPLINEIRRQLEGPAGAPLGATTSAPIAATTAAYETLTTKRRTSSSITSAPTSTTTSTSTTTTTTTRRPTTAPTRRTTSPTPRATPTTTTTTVTTETPTETTTPDIATATVGQEDELPNCNDEGRFWFPGSDCGEYYDCTSGQAVLQRCKKGMVWKQKMLWCDYPHNSPRVACNPLADSGSAPKPIDN